MDDVFGVFAALQEPISDGEQLPGMPRIQRGQSVRISPGRIGREPGARWLARDVIRSKCRHSALKCGSPGKPYMAVTPLSAPTRAGVSSPTLTGAAPSGQCSNTLRILNSLLGWVT